ncbi:unnamed protein product [Auanema sp. JU1783]|nr:unnamed protein product [Auanema sp. JU1783]
MFSITTRIARLSKESLRNTKRVQCFSSAKSSDDKAKPWEDPWKHALPPQQSTYSDAEELKIDWKFVERLLPHEVVPDLPKHSSYPTPSGWQPPASPSPALPYYVRRKRDHTFALYLERRRDELNEQTLDFEYVELVVIKGVDGDVMAFNKDLVSFLESTLGHPIASHVDELKGRIKVKGAERSLIEKFLFKQGF